MQSVGLKCYLTGVDTNCRPFHRFVYIVFFFIITCEEKFSVIFVFVTAPKGIMMPNTMIVYFIRTRQQLER
jgi:hypothetical protein